VRRKGAPKATSSNSKATAKLSVINSKKQSPKRTGQSVAKGKKDFPTADPTSPVVHMEASITLTTLESLTNDDGFSVFSAPLSVPLTKVFCLFPKSEKADIQGHEMKDLAFANEDDKAIDQHLKRGTKLINVASPTPLDWHELFLRAFDYEAGSNMQDFSLNLAASDPLELFPPEAIDRLGNLFEGRLSSAWTAATACLGSVHLFFDRELLSNKTMAAAYDSGIEDDAQHCVPISSQPSPAYLNLAAAEKEESQFHAYPERLGDTPDGRCLQDSIASFSKHFKNPEKNMSIAKWRHCFGDASSKGTLIAASGYGRQLRAFGSNLALSPPQDLFMAHEWVSATHLRPQVHSLAWFAAVEMFGPLWLHRDALVNPVVQTMNSGEISDKDDEEDSNDDSETVEVVDKFAGTTGNVHQPSDPMDHAEPTDKLEVDDDSSAVTPDAGTDHLVQQCVSGNHRAHQLRYNIRLHVAPSEEADKSMIAAAKTFFSKAKEMDKSLVICLWFKKSMNPNIKNVGSIPDQMGAFKQHFHQAQPKVAGGFLCMRLWLGLDEDPKLLEEDF
jgi:hypothetical protein